VRPDRSLGLRPYGNPQLNEVPVLALDRASIGAQVANSFESMCDFFVVAGKLLEYFR